EELVQQTRTAHEELLPVVEALDGAVPADGSASPEGEEPDAGEVDDWLAATDGAAEHFENVPSGETDYNIAHAGLANSVDLLGSAVVAYSGALEAEDEGLRTEMTELAGDLRTQAVRSWSVAATQLDVLSLDAGHGRRCLPAAPGGAPSEPDPAEDGDGAAEDGRHDHCARTGPGARSPGPNEEGPQDGPDRSMAARGTRVGRHDRGPGRVRTAGGRGRADGVRDGTPGVRRRGAPGDR